MAVECTYCEEKISAKHGIYIKCSTCQDMKLCLECFSAGAAIGEHESDHPYELIDCGSFSIVDESWKAHEELALLEAIELYGIGSWTDIANAVEGRSPEECSDRYLKVYVDNFFGRSTWNAIDRNLYTVHDHTCKFNEPLSPSLSKPEKHKIVDITKEQQVRLGYMPKRDDFEREYDNEAEFLVSKLPVNANDDTDLDREFKIAHINMYTDKLRERFRRKRVVLDYNLVKLFFHMHPEENVNSPQDPSLAGTSSSQTKFLDTNDQLDEQTGLETSFLDIQKDHHDQSGLPSNGRPIDTTSPKTHQESNSDQKSQIPIQNTILNYFRRVDSSNQGNPSSGLLSTCNGDIPTSDPNSITANGTPKSTANSSILSSYFSDLNKSIAEQDFNTMEKKLRIFCQFNSADEHNQLIRNLAREKELKFSIRELIKRRKSGVKSLNTGANDNDVLAIKQSPTKNSTSKNLNKNAQLHELVEPMEVDTDGATNTPTKVTQKKGNKNESTKAINNSLLNQNSQPCWRLLSKSEKRLCKTSNLEPSQYITMKAFFIKEHKQKKRKGSSQKLLTDDMIDKNTKRRILDFLTRNNWIKV